MDNRPVSIKKPIIAFRQSELSFKVTYTNLLEMPDVISAQFWVGSTLHSTEQAQITGNQAEFNIPASSVSLLPTQCQVYFLHDGVMKFGGSCMVSMGVAPNPSLTELSVTLSGDQEFVVELVAIDSINEQVDAARQFAEQTSSDAAQTAADRAQATQDAATASTKAEEAAAARDATIEASLEIVRVGTYAEAVPYFTGPARRLIKVAADEAYYEGEKSEYTYDPIDGVAQWGIDYNYTEL